MNRKIAAQLLRLARDLLAYKPRLIEILKDNEVNAQSPKRVVPAGKYGIEKYDHRNVVIKNLTTDEVYTVGTGELTFGQMTGDVKMARELIAEDKFTVVRRLSLTREGATRDSLENARRIKKAGYEVKSTVYRYDKQKSNFDLEVTFERDGETPVHHFKGFSWGYEGEGTRGLVEFGEIFGIKLDEQKIFGNKDVGLPEKGFVSLDAFK